MNNNIELAINEKEIDETILEIINYADKISVIFDKIDKKYETIKDFLKGNSTEEIAKKYNEIKTNYIIIKDNIISYSDDLIILKNKMNIGEKHIANTINTHAQDFTNKIKEVNINGN